MLSDWLQQFCTYCGGTLCLVGHALSLRVHRSSQQSLHLSVTLIVSSIVHNNHKYNYVPCSCLSISLALSSSLPRLTHWWLIIHQTVYCAKERKRATSSWTTQLHPFISLLSWIASIHPVSFREIMRHKRPDERVMCWCEM